MFLFSPSSLFQVKNARCNFWLGTPRQLFLLSVSIFKWFRFFAQSSSGEVRRAEEIRKWSDDAEGRSFFRVTAEMDLALFFFFFPLLGMYKSYQLSRQLPFSWLKRRYSPIALTPYHRSYRLPSGASYSCMTFSPHFFIFDR